MLSDNLRKAILLEPNLCSDVLKNRHLISSSTPFKAEDLIGIIESINNQTQAEDLTAQLVCLYNLDIPTDTIPINDTPDVPLLTSPYLAPTAPVTNPLAAPYLFSTILVSILTAAIVTVGMHGLEKMLFDANHVSM